jgi:Zn-dependent protease
MTELFTTLYDASAWVIPVVLAITLHEAAHGYVARRFGDLTATLARRVTLNPLRHVDRVGTILLPALLLVFKSPVIFGFAKPVPVNFNALRPRRPGMIAVALAGPGINFALAIVSALMLHLEAFITPEQAPWLYMNVYRSIIINCGLAMFNLLPIPPLDGARVLHGLLPPRLGELFGRTERYGLIFVLILLFLPPLMGVDALYWLVGVPAGWAVETILHLTGSGAQA